MFCCMGCAVKQRYVEGTHITLGAYLPFQDSIYGVELLSYTGGASLNVSTNMNVQFEREYAATNEYFWGMVKTREKSKSKLKTEAPFTK